MCLLTNRNYNKIVASDWPSPGMIFPNTRHRARAGRGQLHFHVFFTSHLRVKTIFFPEKVFFYLFSNFVIDTINW